MKGNGILPDLRYMSEQTHRDFIGIVIGGAQTHQGMIGFHETLDIADAEAIHAYLDQEQRELPDKLTLSFLQELEYWIMYWSARIGEKYPELLNATRGLIM